MTYLRNRCNANVAFKINRTQAHYSSHLTSVLLIEKHLFRKHTRMLFFFLLRSTSLCFYVSTCNIKTYLLRPAPSALVKSFCEVNFCNMTMSPEKGFIRLHFHCAVNRWKSWKNIKQFLWLKSAQSINKSLLHHNWKSNESWRKHKCNS